jgi:hypothetical protein
VALIDRNVWFSDRGARDRHRSAFAEGRLANPGSVTVRIYSKTPRRTRSFLRVPFDSKTLIEIALVGAEDGRARVIQADEMEPILPQINPQRAFANSPSGS